MENILLNVTVKLKDGYTGNFREAIDETYELAKKLQIGCLLTYANQRRFTILPTMTEQDINKIKERKFMIGV